MPSQRSIFMELKIEKHERAESFEDLCYEYHKPECEGDWHGFELIVCGHGSTIYVHLDNLNPYCSEKAFLEFMKLRHLSLHQLELFLKVLEAQLKNYSEYLADTFDKTFVGCDIHNYSELYDAYYELKEHLMPLAKNKKHFLQYFSFFNTEE